MFDLLGRIAAFACKIWQQQKKRQIKHVIQERKTKNVLTRNPRHMINVHRKKKRNSKFRIWANVSEQRHAVQSGPSGSLARESIYSEFQLWINYFAISIPSSKLKNYEWFSIHVQLCRSTNSMKNMPMSKQSDVQTTDQLVSKMRRCFMHQCMMGSEKWSHTHNAARLPSHPQWIE